MVLELVFAVLGLELVNVTVLPVVSPVVFPVIVGSFKLNLIPLLSLRCDVFDGLTIESVAV